MQLPLRMRRMLPAMSMKSRKTLLATTAVVLLTIGLFMRTMKNHTEEAGQNEPDMVAWKKLSNAAGNLQVEEITYALCSANVSKPRECSKALSEVPYFEMYNAVEDAKLQLYIGQEKHRIKAVIYYLANPEVIEKLIKSITLLYKNFNQQHRYPIVIFHEADFLLLTESVRCLGFIDETKMSSIFFQQVDLSVPKWYLKKFGEPSVIECGRDIGYRGMCRFQAKLLYEQTILRHFDYYWRLDDDSFISSAISHDVFDVLKAGRYSYGFFMSNIDDCAGTLYKDTENYMKRHGITPTFYHKLKRNEILFNNFEVSSFKFWRSRQYRDFIEHIDSLGGIYKHRWGDAPIKTLALSMFVPLRELFRFQNITYEHEVQKKFVSNFLIRD